WGQRQNMRGDTHASLVNDLQSQLCLLQGDVEPIGARVPPRQRKTVFVDEVIDRDLPLVLLVCRAPANRCLVEGYRNQAITVAGSFASHAARGSTRSATERAWPSRPSA